MRNYCNYCFAGPIQNKRVEQVLIGVKRYFRDKRIRFRCQWMGNFALLKLIPVVCLRNFSKQESENQCLQNAVYNLVNSLQTDQCN